MTFRASVSISDRTHADVSSAFSRAASSNSFRSSAVRRTWRIESRASPGGFLGPLVQLVDYVCGAVTRSLRAESTDADEYREIIRGREGMVWVWPRKSETG